MNSSQRKLKRILRLARQAHAAPARAPEEPIDLPFGFSTRIASRWASEPREPSLGQLWERASAWGLGCAAAIWISCAILGQRPEPPLDAFDLFLNGVPIEGESTLS